MTQDSLFPPSVLEARGMAALIPVHRVMVRCGKCAFAQSRTSVVLGEGNPHADLMFIGEAPGRAEDLAGRPFLGHAGDLLTKMLLAMGLTREMCYLTNVVACRPPQGKSVEAAEVEACSAYLHQQIRAVQPKCIVTLGSTAARTLTKTKKGVVDLRGHWYKYTCEGVQIPVRCTYHPAFLLRPAGVRCKGEVWRDLQHVLHLLGLTPLDVDHER